MIPRQAEDDPSSSRLLGLVPGLALLKNYQLTWLRSDLVAGTMLAAYLLPAGIGDASLAGLPPEAGIYACLFAGLVFWLFCSSRHTSITVTSAISLLVGTSLASIAGGDAQRFAALTSFTALFVALIAFVAWLAKAGVIVNFISETVLTGFKTGIALYLASTQLPKLFGFKGGSGSFWERSAYFLGHINETNPAALTVGVSALVILVLGKMFLKNRPVGLFVVIGGIVVTGLFGLESRGVKLLGDVPQGLPAIGFPSIELADFNTVLPLAFACFLLGAVETAAIGRMFTAKHGGRFDADQEFLALAGSNLAAGLGRGYPVSGGMSQSLVNESGGAKTPLSGLVASGLMLIVCLFLSGSLHDLPQPILAAVVLFAVGGLFKVSELRHLRLADKSEFFIAMAAVAGVLTSGILRGVLIGAVISLVELLRRSSQPHVAVLGRIPGTNRFSDLERNPENEAIPGIVIVRVESSLVYFNIEYVCEAILQRVRTSPSPVKLVICELSASPRVDLQSAETLGGLADELAASGIQIQVVEARSSVRDRLRAGGLDEKLGDINRHHSVAQAIEDFQQ